MSFVVGYLYFFKNMYFVENYAFFKILSFWSFFKTKTIEGVGDNRQTDRQQADNRQTDNEAK